MLFLLAHGSDGGLLFWRQKSNQKTVGTYGFQASLMHPVIVFAIPGLLSGYRAMAFEVPFAGRPPFFLLEKRRRSPSSLKAAGL